ncbi:toll/interleukin-1 receptor domain-containing protein [Clostridium perfringens]|uniref:toll/interleukin-1 receptor domain-containing protein n=1 Tax=Clostridium perfringens TaxID=1502 RepID=UPI0013D3DEEE|nr:toll/interleukin-1 receptor domain-containing protein [Clostridium perfringens]KAF2784968.1 hypothetical protein SV13_02375 [Clostridium perfringens]MBI5992614.1 toll/interleukin-1 receptor domain-containing protein [Clostridium perfringens]MDK0724931.1 toll/interleukin-1 receptor domain-containing protein [Clostridium perfringens]MDU1113596.1 toll/interleukin-1 receptor domain-containing protein [Clostridium perfringens]MDU1596998.1 toll/interleukin-1 receptor domain-containing protein [Cl
MPKVFISYSHDSQELEEQVKKLADTLIEYGVEAEIDQYTTNPVQGWPQYMLENVLKSDYILCVCTENYKKRFENEEEIGVGLGAKFEGKYIKQILYTTEYNEKVLPILFKDTDNETIPMTLQPYTHYKLYKNGEFEKLYGYITGQSLVKKPKLGSIISLESNTSGMLGGIVFGNSDTGKKEENNLLIEDKEIIEESADIDMFEYPTPFFDYRMGKAFPGIRYGKWFIDPEEIIERLKILLRKPLNRKKRGMTDPIWWFRGGSCFEINHFEVISAEKCIIENKECVVDKIYVYRSSSYYRSFIYVELKPENPVGVYESSEERIKMQMNHLGYADEEYATYNGQPITRGEYDDGAGFINGKYVEFNLNTKIRIRYLTKYNFIICAKFNPINSNKGDIITEKILDSLLKNECNIEELVNEIEKLPRNRSDY